MAASAADGHAAPRRLAVQWLWFGLAIAAVIVYLSLRILAANHHEPSGDAVAPGNSADDVGTQAAAGVAPATAVEPPRAPTISAVPGAAPPPVDAKTAAAPEPRNAAGKTRLRKATAKVEPPNPAPPPAPKAEPAPEPRAPPPQAAAVIRDPWQPMNEGLARCAREDWIGRANCEQRLRQQYCANHWGQVAQCPIGPTDHGS